MRSEAGTGPSRNRPVVLVAGATEDDAPPDLASLLADRVDLVWAGDPDAVARGIGDAEIVFAWRPEADFLERAWRDAVRVRWVQSASAGVDALLFPALIDSDVVLTNARGVFDEAMAEYTIGLLLCFVKDFVGTIDRQREARWDYRYSETLAGSTLLVVGAGSIGSAVGRLGRAFGMRVEGVARTPRSADEVFERTGGREDLLDHLARADHVVNVLPATSHTEHIFDERAFAAMRPGSRFVNVGRGSTVDETALVDALRSGRIAGAALDVFEREPLPADSPLWAMDNVIVSPHMSGDLRGWERAIVQVFADNLDRWLRGAPLRNVVDKRLGYAPRTATPAEPEAGAVSGG